MRVVEPFICNLDDRIIKVHWRINGKAAEGQMGRVGDGEVELSLVEEEEGVVAQAVVHLARAPKSHEVYHALGRVYKEIDGSGAQPNVPLHLRNATSSMTRDLGWGKGYSSDLRKVQAIDYLPEELNGANFFG